TIVTCSATGTNTGLTTTGTFTVTVVDTTAPTVTLFNLGYEVNATGPAGTAFKYLDPAVNGGHVPQATDLVDGTVPVTCTPPSGATFPLGTTALICRATDLHGNTGVA